MTDLATTSESRNGVDRCRTVDEAETALGEGVMIRRELFGNNSPTLSVVTTRLSRVHFYRGDYGRFFS